MALWVVRAGKDGEQEEGVLQNNVVAHGWNNLGDLSQFNDFKSFYKYYKQIFPREEHGSSTNYDISARLGAGQVWNFQNKIQIGDYVVLPSKKTDEIHIGKIIGDYEYKKYADNIKHTRRVEWLKKINRTDVPKKITDSLGTNLTVFNVKKNNAENYVIDLLESPKDKFEKGEKIIGEHLKQKTGKPYTGFDHPTLVEEVNYKLEIRDRCLKKLQLEKWDEWVKTPGKIIDAVKSATRISGNLLSHQYGPKSNSDSPLYQIDKTKEFEQILYDLFFGGPKDPDSIEPRLDKLINFVYENHTVRSWRFFSFLLFLLDSERYFPITPTKFNTALEFYGVKEKFSRQKKSWKKYQLVLGLVEELKSKLSKKYAPISNLQTQSYLWVLTDALEVGNDNPKTVQEIIDFLENMVMQENYQPVTIKTLVENGGHASEDIVSDKLTSNNPDSESKYMLDSVTKVLKSHNIITEEDDELFLNVKGELNDDDAKKIIEKCDDAINDFGGKKNLQKIAICFPTDRGIEKIGIFSEIITEKGKVIWGVNWSAKRIKKSDYPIKGYIYFKGKIIAIANIQKITEHSETSADDMLCRPTALGEPGDYTHYIHIDDFQECDPFPHTELTLWDTTKEIPKIIQQRVYVQQISSTRTPLNWIWSSTPESWEILKKKKIWASKIPQKIRERVRPGDRVVFYVIGTGQFKGIFEFLSEWYDAPEPVWEDEKDAVKYHSQIKLHQIKIGSINVYDIAPKLSIFPNYEDKRSVNLVLKGAGGYPSNTGKPIPEDDFKKIT